VMAIVWGAFTFITDSARATWAYSFPRTIVGVGRKRRSPAGGTGPGSPAVYPSGSRGRVWAIFNMLVVAGISIAFALGGLISKQMGGWQYPFFVFAIPGILLGTLAFLHEGLPDGAARGTITQRARLGRFAFRCC